MGEGRSKHHPITMPDAINIKWGWFMALGLTHIPQLDIPHKPWQIQVNSIVLNNAKYVLALPHLSHEKS